MSKIDDFKKFTREHSQSLEWADLVGARYAGGGGGVGRLFKLEVEATIYHQERDGATNYHDAPGLMQAAIEKQIRLRFTEILAAAREDLAEQRTTLAQAARDEHAELMRESGLEVAP